MTTLAALGDALRSAGLVPQMLAAWAGTARLSALPARLEGRGAAGPRAEATPTGALFALFVAGERVRRAQLRLADDLVEALVAHGLVAREDDLLVGRVAVLPLAPRALAICDRLDAPVERDVVCWPDDSSHHLASALPPGLRTAWLDLGCGSAIAPLVRPRIATAIHGVDLNPRGVAYARLGAAMSDVPYFTAAVGDIGDAHAPADLVTCNAPIPGAGALEPELWRAADAGFFDRLWPALRRAVRPGGLVVVHAALDALEGGLDGADGERVIIRYTPHGARGFGVAWWRPDAPRRWILSHRALTSERPHLHAHDRDDALAEC